MTLYFQVGASRLCRGHKHGNDDPTGAVWLLQKYIFRHVKSVAVVPLSHTPTRNPRSLCPPHGVDIC